MRASQLTAVCASLLLTACGVVDEGGADPTASSIAALSMPAGDALHRVPVELIQKEPNK